MWLFWCWWQVFRARTPPEAIDLVSRLLEYTPSSRISPLQACAHTFFDELRETNTRLPNGRELPPLFNFTEQGELILHGPWIQYHKEFIYNYCAHTEKSALWFQELFLLVMVLTYLTHFFFLCYIPFIFLSSFLLSPVCLSHLMSILSSFLSSSSMSFPQVKLAPSICSPVFLFVPLYVHPVLTFVPYLARGDYTLGPPIS